jgi:hypothetical protein
MSTVLPALGGETISPRCPLPIGAMMSMMRLVMFSSALMSRSSLRILSGCSGVRFSNRILCLEARLQIHLVDLDQREVALAVLGRPDLALDRIPGVQVEASYLGRADVDVVGGGEVGGIGGAQKAETVGEHFERAVAVDRLAFLRAILEQGEDQLLLAHPVGAIHFVGLRHIDEIADVQVFQLG